MSDTLSYRLHPEESPNHFVLNPPFIVSVVSFLFQVAFGTSCALWLPPLRRTDAARRSSMFLIQLLDWLAFLPVPVPSLFGWAMGPSICNVRAMHGWSFIGVKRLLGLWYTRYLCYCVVVGCVVYLVEVLVHVNSTSCSLYTVAIWPLICMWLALISSWTRKMWIVYGETDTENLLSSRFFVKQYITLHANYHILVQTRRWWIWVLEYDLK